MKIRSGGAIRGLLEMPGDKSISHRAAMLAAIADGTTRISNFAPGEDARSTLNSLRGMGVAIEIAEDVVRITGRGLSGLLEPDGPLDCGNSGTTMRLIAGIAAGQPFTTSLTGDSSLASRPMGRIIGPLEEMGAVIKVENNGLPITISGRRPLKPLTYLASKPSAQVKSCILLAGLWADGVTSVQEKVATRDHTERMFGHFGVDMQIDAGRMAIRGGSRLTSNDLVVPGDISSAAFFLIAAAACPGSDLLVRAVGVNRSRSAILPVLERCGALVDIVDPRTFGPEPVADIRVRHAELRSGHFVIDGPNAALLIDEAPILAVLGTQLPSGLSFRDAADLRNKECDRIDAICRNLRAMGAAVEEFPDGFRITRSRLVGAAVKSFGDHRIAMAMSIAALLAEGPTVIDEPNCVSVSYPGFFETLDSVVM